MLGKSDKLEKKLEDLEDRMQDIEDKTEARQKENLKLFKDIHKSLGHITSVTLVVNISNIQILNPVDTRVLIEKVETKFENAITEQTQMLENISQRIAELDLNKRNNLFFNGIPWEHNETSEKLFRKIKTLIKSIFTKKGRFFR